MSNIHKPEYQALVKRWNTYLQKMEIRFHELLEQSKEAVFDNLRESDYDLNPSTRLCQTMRVQLLDVIQKVDEMFDTKVRPQMQLYVESHEHLDQTLKASKLQERLHHRLERFAVELEGELSIEFYNHAIKFQDDDFNCSQCGGLLKIKKDVFRAQYITCKYCQATNTFTPKDKVMNIGWTVVDNIAKYKSLKEWDTKQAAEAYFHSLRDNRVEEERAMNDCEQATRSYWTTYLQERVQLMSEYKETYEVDLEAKMKSFFDWKKIQLR